MGRVSLDDVDGPMAEAVAEAMHALATPSRVRLLARLCDGPCSVGALAVAVGLEQSLVSHQLRLLRQLHDDHVADLLAQAVHHVDHTRIADERAAARG